MNYSWSWRLSLKSKIDLHMTWKIQIAQSAFQLQVARDILMKLGRRLGGFDEYLTLTSHEDIRLSLPPRDYQSTGPASLVEANGCE